VLQRAADGGVLESFPHASGCRLLLRIMWRDYLWVGLGGALGSMARFGMAALAMRWLGERAGETLPWGTLLVNLSGSFAMGVFSGLTGSGQDWIAQPAGRHFLLVGVCGGYTTFSSFSMQTLRLMQNRSWVLAGWNIAGSMLGCLAAVWIGHWLAVTLTSRRV